MAALFQPDGRFGSGLQLFSDGQEMLVTFGRDLFRLNAPLVNSIKINHDGGHFYETLGGSGMRRYIAAPPRVEVEIVADMGMTCRDCGIPDLTAFAERLTVEQLFQVIQKKLKERERERP